MHFQKALPVFCLLCFLIQAQFAGPDLSPLSSEKARFSAQVSCDTLLLAKLLHPELKYIHSNGMTENASEFLQSIARKRIVYQQIEPQAETCVRYPKEGVAVMDGRINVIGFLHGNAFEVKLAYTSVYLLVSDQWLLYAWQSAKMP